MGKKTKRNSKQAWKKSETAKEYEEAMGRIKEDEKITKKASESLFYIDVNGSERLRKRVLEDEIDETSTKEEKKKVMLLKKELLKGKKESKKREKNDSPYDLWETPEPKKLDSKGFLREEDLEVSKKKRKVERVITKPNAYPAVVVAKPGTSYNPDTEQHQDAIGEELAKEVDYSAYVEDLHSLPSGITKSDLMNQKIDPNILSSKLYFDDSEDEEEANSDGSYTKKTTKRITDSKRRRRIEQKLEQAKRQEEKNRKRIDVDILRSKTIAKEIAKEEAKKEDTKRIQQETKALKEERRIPAIIRGGVSIKEKPVVDILLSDEITGDLRTMKNVSNPVSERFESIDRRHLVALGGKKEKRKYDKIRIKKNLKRRQG